MLLPHVIILEYNTIYPSMKRVTSQKTISQYVKSLGDHVLVWSTPTVSSVSLAHQKWPLDQSLLLNHTLHANTSPPPPSLVPQPLLSLPSTTLLPPHSYRHLTSLTVILQHHLFHPFPPCNLTPPSLVATYLHCLILPFLSLPTCTAILHHWLPVIPHTAILQSLKLPSLAAIFPHCLWLPSCATISPYHLFHCILMPSSHPIPSLSMVAPCDILKHHLALLSQAAFFCSNPP